ncbi:MAG: PEP-CTERM system histidine kinase PrsK, partial [Nitrososphaerota archaeon]
ALRASVGRTRWKVKYLVFGLGLWCAYKIYSGGQALLFHGLEFEGLVLGSWAGCGASAFLLVGVLRSGGTQIQLPLSHWALYQSATLILVGAYFLLVGVIAQILKLVGALSEVHYVAALTLFAMGGLAVILFSDRVRYAIRRFISHHFKATVYDYRSIWTKFSQRTSSSIDEKSLCAESVRFLSETLEALSVSLWLKVPDQNRMRLAASTVMDRNQARDFPLNGMEAGEFLDLLCKEAHPVVDLETHNKEAMRTWKEANREFLAQAKARYLAPLIAGGESLGLIALGERVRWAPMSFEDMELMRTLADHTAKSLRQLRLLEEVRRSRELEAFQAMSAFLVHDLKNLSSKLALVAQNLPEFYEEEEFRRDALRVMTQCVDKIKAMCQQLTFMRQGLNPVCKPLDLNSLVEEVLRELNGLLAARVELQKENSVTVSADPELLKRVLSNLILNSHEATEGRGKILIKTFRGADGWVGFSVEDDGPGMSQEFMDQCLFRPFRTTKSKGMGIGLFQCKSIVEAHQGRIEVESSPAKGTKVKVLLPQKTRANRQGMETAPM